MDRQAANGGLGEYYSEADTRVPTWVVAGDRRPSAGLSGLDEAALAGGFARHRRSPRRGSTTGSPPTGRRGRAFTQGERARLRPDVRRAQERVAAAGADRSTWPRRCWPPPTRRPSRAAMTYLHQHAGYTRVHNPLTGMKDLQRLPGLVAIAYQHETSRCGDPHLHTHVIVPNRQPRADGVLVSLDSKSLYHEAKAAGIDLPGRPAPRAARRAGLRVERRWIRTPGWPRSPASPRTAIKAWSQRSTRLREWAHRQPGRRRRGADRGAAGGRAEGHPPGQARNRWRGTSSRSSGAPMRAVSHLDRDAHHRGARMRAAPQRARALDRARHGARWRRTSTRPRSRAPTWSSWSARSCPWTHPAIRAS